MKKDLPFESVFYDATRLAKKIPQSDYLPKGYYPILDQGKKYISGYYNDNLGLFSDVPAIIFGDHTRIIKFITSPCFIGADGVKLLKFKTKDNPKYLYYALQSLKIPNTGYNRHFRLLKEAKIRIWPKNIQEKIVLILDKIKSIIENKNRQIENIDIIAKSRFIEMFGDVGKDEFGWGLKRLDSCCTINPKKTSEKHLTDSLEVSFCPMQYISEKGDIKTDDLKTYNEVKKGFTYFAENDVVFAKITPCMENGKGAIAKNLRNGIGFGSTEFHVLRPNQNMITPEWLYFLMSFQQFRKDAESNMTGSAGQRRVPADFLKKYKVSIPPLSLQYEYKKFLQQLDKSKFRMKMCLKIMSFIRHL